MLTPDHLVQTHSATWLTKRQSVRCPYEANCQQNITDTCFIDETTACNVKQQEQYLQYFQINICKILMSLNASLKS